MYRKFRSIFDGVTETVKSEIKKQKGGVLAFLMAPKASSLIASVAFSLLPGIFAFFWSYWNGIWQEGGIVPLIASALLKDIFGKRVTRTGKESREQGEK